MKLNILHTNDIHSHIENLGYAAGYIERVRKANPNTLLVDAGDMITGDFQFKFNQGLAEQELNNYLKYDVVTVGNHDFDIDFSELKQHMNNINADYVLSNLEDTNNIIGDFSKSLIKEVNGVRIGFVSFVLPYIKTHLDLVMGAENSFEFIEEEVYQQIVDQIRPDVDILIALNHQGIDRDTRLAQTVEGIDLIIGAHSHTTLETPLQVNDSYIFQTGCFAKNIGNIELNIKNKKIDGLEYKLIAINDELESDINAQAIVDRYLQVAIDNSSEVYGSCRHKLDGERELMIKNSTNLGSLICDSYLDYAQVLGYKPDFAFINARGLRQSIECGDITYKTLYNVMPFEKQLYIFDISGSELKAGLSNPIELQTAKLRIVKDGQTKVLYDQVEGKEIEDDKIYQVVTMNYLYEHHLFSALQNSKLVASNLGSDIEVVSSYIKKLGHGFEYENNRMVEYREKL